MMDAAILLIVDGSRQRPFWHFEMPVPNKAVGAWAMAESKGAESAFMTGTNVLSSNALL